MGNVDLFYDMLTNTTTDAKGSNSARHNIRTQKTENNCDYCS